jgi:hypothetical protein
MIQVPEWESRTMHYEFSNYDWTVIKPMLRYRPSSVLRENDRGLHHL